MKKLRWQLLVVVFALVAISGLLLTQQQTASPVDVQGEAPVAGGKFSEALIGSPGRFNPLLDYYNQVDYDVDSLIFSRMFRFDDRGLPHGDLVDSWNISKDGKKYGFFIRPTAVWHDGQPVTSDDIVFTIDLMKDEKTPLPEDLHAFWQQVKVLPLDEKTLQFILPEPFAPFLDYLSFGILPRHILEGVTAEQLLDAPFNLNPVGSGPYRFTGVEIDDGKISAVALTAFEGYYGEKPFITELTFNYYPDANTALGAYDSGKIQGVSQIPDDLLPVALSSETLQVFTGRLPRWSLIYLNLDNDKVSFFQDQTVRRALLMSINRRRIIDQLLGGQGILANGPIFPESWAYYDTGAPVEYDPQTAVALLKKAEYIIPAEGGNVRAKEGLALSFDLLYPQGELHQKIAEQIRSDWAKIGVEARLKEVTYPDMLSDYLEPHTYQAALAEIDLSRSPDPDPYPFWHQAQITNGQNYSQWDDRQVSEYLEQARVKDDPNERLRRYRNFQVRWAIELPALPLYYPVYSYGVDAAVKGISMGALYDPSERFTSILSWYLLTGPATAQTLSTATP